MSINLIFYLPEFFIALFKYIFFNVDIIDA